MSRDAKAETAVIRRILWEDWDPIGCGVPEDEYDSYVWPVYALLIRNRPCDEIEAYLKWAADVNMAAPVAEEVLRRVLDKLMALGLGAKA